MIIHKVAIGNTKEAFIESSFADTINIISSDDNNKGKTILIQSLMYCLGNKPTFPSSFNYTEYFYIVVFSVELKRFVLCRKDDTFVIKSDSSLLVFSSIAELKRYWNKNIFALPSIIKNNDIRIVDPELFVQIFFVGQDKKDTSRIANQGFYNKDDFYNMIYSIMNLGNPGIAPDEIETIKMSIRNLKDERSVLLRGHKILKSKKKTANYLSSISDKISFEAKVKRIEYNKDQIAEFRVLRNSAINRKVKCEITLKELNSLNRSIDSGELRCMDCDSTHIGFRAKSNSSCSFDVSTPEIRKQIIDSINEKIAAYQEDIDRLTREINQAQEKLQISLKNEDITLESIVAYKHDILDASEAERRIIEIDNEIQRLSDRISTNESSVSSKVEKQCELLENIIRIMNSTYKGIDFTGNLKFTSLFTTRDKIYSGSEATVFHLVKLYALAKVLQHNYPIVVDSFRAEDLSTGKENTVLDLFSSLGNQVIFTTTLKTEELGKYNDNDAINHIDFTSNAPSKMLDSSYVDEFLCLTRQLAITIE